METDDEKLAGDCYKLFRKLTDQNCHTVTWEEAPDHVRKAWIAVVRLIRACPVA